MNKVIKFCVYFFFMAVATPGLTQQNNVDLSPKKTITGDTVNSDYLKGEARRLRTNCESVKTKATELVTLYKGYVDRTKACPKAKEEASLALSMAKKALKDGETGIKLANEAEKTNKMPVAKKNLKLIEARLKSAHEYLKESEERKKEVEFEMRGCN